MGAAVLRSIRRAFTDLTQVRMLVLGGGEAGRDIAYHLSKVRLASLTFCRPQTGTGRVAWRGNSMAHRGVERSAQPVRRHRCLGGGHFGASRRFLDRDSLRCFTQSRSRQLLIVDAGDSPQCRSLAWRNCLTFGC